MRDLGENEIPNEAPWSQLLRSIEKKRSHGARFFKPVCLIAVIDGVASGEISPSNIDPNLVIEKFRQCVAGIFPDRADLGWRPFWHLSNDGAWDFTKEGQTVRPINFGTARKPDSRGQLLVQIDHVAVSRTLLPYWQSTGAIQELRNRLLEMMDADDDDCRAMAVSLRNTALPSLQPTLQGSASQEKTSRKSVSRGQGFQSLPEYRRAIERRAMRVALDLLEMEGWTTQDVSASECYDIHCSRNGEEAYVEVKGTSGIGDQIILTRAEVQFAQENSVSMILIIVSDIEVYVHDAESVDANGGVAAVFRCWSPDSCRLQPISYLYRL